MRILKFGGSSLATAERIAGAAEIVARTPRPVAVVVSALGGVTDGLAEAAAAAARRDPVYEQRLEELVERHRKAVAAVAVEGEREALAEEVTARGGDLGDLLHGAWLLCEATPRTRDSILAYGERWAALLVAAALRGRGIAAEAVDSRRLIVTDATFGSARVDLEATLPRLREALRAADAVTVLTGFIAATPGGETTTLGRGGSDYTAALAGAAVGAEAVELWTDVSGVFSADPRLVPDAFPLPELSYAELMELSHFGAKVVYPPSVHPARARGVPLVIRSSFDPEAPGTRVAETAPGAPHPVRGIASIHRVALLSLEGDGMVGVPGIAMRLFGALARRRVSVILISQASSEHSICFAVAPEDAAAAAEALREEFDLERRVGVIDDPRVEEELSVVAVVGEGMRHRPGIAGRLFSVLGEAAVNVRAIAQGSSERNISLVVGGDDEATALRTVHRAFFAPRHRTLEVAVAGVGRVGRVLLDQLAAVAAEGSDLEVRLVAVAASRRMTFDPAGIPLDGWAARLAEGEPTDWEDLAGRLAGARQGVRVLVDCTASDVPGRAFPRLLAAGVGVVAANKRPFAGSQKAFDALREAAAAGRAPLRFEATAGAGLPVLSTLATLVATGDRVRRIDGVLSGSLGYVLDRVDGGARLSEAMSAAAASGLTEPHPWDDLSGADVGRKLVILARVAGITLEPEAVHVEPLLPGGGWEGLSAEGLWERLPEADAALEARRQDAAEDGRRLRYVASLAEGVARVGMEAVGPEHPCWGVAGADNLVAFTTDRYRTSPLVVRGPGAGPEVTAAGVLGELLALAGG